MKPNLGIADADRTQVISRLQSLLADEFVAYVKTHIFHWNVVGMSFSPLHALFASQYAALAGFVDDLAERIRQLGALTPPTLEALVKPARLREVPGTRPSDKEMLSILLAVHEALIQYLREDVTALTGKWNDAGTCNFLTDLMQQHEKMAWLLRAHLEAPG